MIKGKSELWGPKPTRYRYQPYPAHEWMGKTKGNHFMSGPLANPVPGAEKYRKEAYVR